MRECFPFFFWPRETERVCFGLSFCQKSMPPRFTVELPHASGPFFFDSQCARRRLYDPAVLLSARVPPASSPAWCGAPFGEGGSASVDARSEITAQDFALFARCYITREGTEQARLFRVDTHEGARLVGRNGGGDYAGIVFPYYWPGSDSPREYRLRRDKPELEQKPDGALKEKNKYLSPPGRSNLFYIPPGTPPEYLTDITVRVFFTEGEKKALALFRYFMERGERVLVIALSGAWNFRGTVGKTTDEKGRRDVKGIIPDFDRVIWHGRVVYVIYDSNVATNDSVAAARRELAKELKRRGAVVRLVDLPQIDGVNGVDDLLAAKGPEFVSALIAQADTPGKAEDSPLRIACMADVAPEKVGWLWYP